MGPSVWIPKARASGPKSTSGSHTALPIGARSGGRAPFNKCDPQFKQPDGVLVQNVTQAIMTQHRSKPPCSATHTWREPTSASHIWRGQTFSGHTWRRLASWNTDLHLADLGEAHLMGADANQGTVWPAGFDWRAAGVKMLS